MPIKFPKFTRRKSSGNALEAAYEPADQGIYPKEDNSQDSLGSGHGGFKVYPRGNRGSGNTGSSTQSGADYYAGSSNRLSSSSTLPSADIPRTPDDYRPQLLDAGTAGSYPYGYSKPVTGASLSVNPAFSTTRSSGPQYPLETPPRHVAMSTATPPKLETSLDTSSLFGDDLFDFSGSKKSISENSRGIGSITPTAPKIASSIINTSSDIPPVPPPKSYNPSKQPSASRFTGNAAANYSNMFTNSQHLDSDGPPSTESSPYHWDSKPSDDLLTSPINNSPRHSRMLTPGQKANNPNNHIGTDSLEAPRTRPAKARGGSGDGLKRTSALMRRSSLLIDDEDAAIVAGSIQRTNGSEDQGLRLPPGRPTPFLGPETVNRLSERPKDRDSGWEETLQSVPSSDNSLRSSGNSKDTALTVPMVFRGNTDPTAPRLGIDSNHTTPKAKSTGLAGKHCVADTDANASDFDISISAAAALAAKYENSSPGPQIPVTKVMTRAQFERYQNQQDERRRLSGKLADDDDESVISDEEESEVERNRQAAKLRERQDAHLSVYRQQMMKITGTDQPDSALGMNSRMVSMSTSALPLTHSTMRSGPGSTGSGASDEEVPLGILMAHGFPSKNRPPTRLSNASSQPNLRAAAMSQQDPRLPPFARNLPQDPYNVGAGLINPMNRTSLAFHSGGDARSVAGGSMYNSVPPSQLPGRGPGGLVGEIVKAEEQRAARKGMGNQFAPQQRDPFTQDPFERSGSPGIGALGLGVGNNQHMGINWAGNGMQMGPSNNQMGTGMLPPGGLNSADSMQMQMANQMQQMMQVQMQWMQMQVQQQQNQQPMHNLMGQPQPQFMSPTIGQQQRPGSVMSMNTPMGGLGVPQPQPRAMTMIDQQFPQLPAMIRTSYAPSIIQNQMGGGGFIPKYAASIAPSERSTIGLPSRYRPVTSQLGSNGPKSAVSTSLGQQTSRKTAGTHDDSEDDSLWADLLKKGRGQKK